MLKNKVREAEVHWNGNDFCITFLALKKRKKKKINKHGCDT